MPKYQVIVIRRTTHSSTILVAAETEVEAETQALEEVKDSDFAEDVWPDIEYDVEWGSAEVVA